MNPADTKMDVTALRAGLASGLSLKEIGFRLGKSQTTVRYWVEKHGMRKTAQCKHCHTPLKGTGKRSVCHGCRNKKYMDRWTRMRANAIQLLGGSCALCGYNRCVAALEFHHKDPTKKDGSWNVMKKWTWEHILEELEKCLLVCSRCHREIHYGLHGMGFSRR